MAMVRSFVDTQDNVVPFKSRDDTESSAHWALLAVTLTRSDVKDLLDMSAADIKGYLRRVLARFPPEK